MYLYLCILLHLAFAQCYVQFHLYFCVALSHGICIVGLSHYVAFCEQRGRHIVLLPLFVADSAGLCVLRIVPSGSSMEQMSSVVGGYRHLTLGILETNKLHSFSLCQPVVLHTLQH